MKKIASIALPILLIAGLSTTAFAAKEATIDDLLAPYQSVIDKVNAELGSAIYIPDKNKEKVYNNIKDMPPDEVERMLREEYLFAPSYRTPTSSNNYTRDSAMPVLSDESYRYDDYIREDAMGKESGPSWIPNFSGPIHVIPLK